MEGSGLEKVCIVASDFKEIISKIEEYFLLEYSKAYFDNRKTYLFENFGNINGAKKLADLIEFDNSPAATRKQDKTMLQGLSQLSSILSYFSL